MNKNKADQSKYSLSVYHNKKCGLITLVHGDDFITVDNRKNIRWSKNKLEGRFEIKTKIIGQGEGEDREAQVLTRIIRVTPEGWEYEPDQRHADLLIQAMSNSGAERVRAPGEDEKNWGWARTARPWTPRRRRTFERSRHEPLFWSWTAWTCSTRRRRCAEACRRRRGDT